MITFLLWNSIKTLEFSLSDGMKNLTITSLMGNEVLTQDDVLNHCSIELLEIADIGVGIVSLEYKCFYQCRQLKRVFLPNGLKSIKGCSFSECSSLLEIKLPEGLNYTGERIFFNCINLVNITIPSTHTTKFGIFDFYHCSSIVKFEVSVKNPIYKSSFDNSVLIYDNIAIVGPGGYEIVNIPDDVEIVATYFLNICEKVKKIEFSKLGKLRRIENSAFRGTSISEIIFPENLEYIGDSPVSDTVVDRMHFPKSLVSVGNVFATVPKSYTIANGCTALKELDGVVYDGNYSRILLLSSEAHSLNITKSVYDLNFEQFRSSPKLEILYVEDNHSVFWSYENILYTSNKSVLISCPGGVANVSVWKKCKTIAPSAFRGCLISEIHFEDSEITEIHPSAFQSCHLVSHIALPKNISSIGYYCFYNCGINTIVIPPTLREIGNYIFSHSSLACIDFSKCENLTIIYENSFEGCTKLTSIELPPNLTAVRQNCFLGCTSLKFINFPPSIQIIGDSCFKQCKSLDSIGIHSDTKYLNEITTFSFSNCNFSRIYIPSCIKTLGQSCFADNPFLVNVAFEEDSVTFIMAEVFKGCSLVKEILLPKSLSSLSFGGLSQMYGLERIDVMDSNVNFSSVDGVLFDSKETELVSFPGGLTKYEIKGFIKTIKEKAFFRCIFLEELDFSKDAQLEEIGSYTFSECSGLKEIIIPSSVGAIKPYAFSKCTSLNIVSFENESILQKLESNAFDGCIKLKTVRFSNNALKEVSDSVFKNCKELTSFESLSVEVFGEFSFYGCLSLTSLSLLKATRIGANCFRGCSSLTKVVLRSDLTDLGEDSFRDCSRLRSVQYCGVDSFNNSAFFGVDISIAVLENYGFEKFGDHSVWKILDAHCNMPTARFTVPTGAISCYASTFAAAVLGEESKNY